MHPLEEIGIDELYAQGLGWLEIRHEWAARACVHAGVTRRRAATRSRPATSTGSGGEGVELTVDQAGVRRSAAASRRAPELDGIRRAQRAAEAGLAAGISLLRQAANGDGVLWLDGEPLTVERVKAADAACTSPSTAARRTSSSSRRDRRARPATTWATARSGSGDPIVFDLWPRDDASSCFADMTRTFVVGPVSDQVREWHTVTKQALDAATALIRAGVECRSVFDAACEVYEACGLSRPSGRRPPARC